MYSFPVYDSLVRLNEKGEVLPDLATSWEFAANNLTLSMKLREGVRFTDGSDLTAEVVVRNLNRTKNDPASLLASQLRSFESFEAKGPFTVVFRLNTPDVNVLYTLATSAGMIVSAKALDEKVDLSSAPVGSGPYKLVSSGPQGAIYERNEAYFDRSQNQFAKVSFITMVDATARLNALRSGQADASLLYADQWPQIQALVATGNFQVHKFLSPNSLPLWLNTKIKPLDNPKVRMALNLAIDRDEINRGIQNGECEPASQLLQPGVIGHDSNLKLYKRETEKANGLLRDAGVGPFTIDALINISEPYKSIGIALQGQLKAIGVTLNVIPTNATAIRPQFRSGNHGAMLTSLSAAAPDPASILDTVFMNADNPGGVTHEFAKTLAEAKTKPLILSAPPLAPINVSPILMLL